VLGVVLLLARRFGSRLAFAFVLSLLLGVGAHHPDVASVHERLHDRSPRIDLRLGVGRQVWFGRWDLEVFLVIGMLTAFFDLFTAPLITLGLPLLMLFLVRESVQEEYGMRTGVVDTVKFGAIWAVGYASSWASKWFIGSAVIGLERAHQRAGGLQVLDYDRRSGRPIQRCERPSTLSRPLGANLAMLVPLFGLKDDLAGLADRHGRRDRCLGVRSSRGGSRARAALPQAVVPVDSAGAASCGRRTPYVWYAVWHTPSTQHSGSTTARRSSRSSDTGVPAAQHRLRRSHGAHPRLGLGPPTHGRGLPAREGLLLLPPLRSRSST